MKPPLLAVLVLAAVLDASAADTNILGRAYVVEPGIWEILSATNHGAASTGALADELRSFFESIGVSFPEGSSIRRQGNLLIIWNTPENLERFHMIWNAGGLPSDQVEIDGSFVAFPATDLDAAARKSARAAATAEDVRALWRGGAGRLVSTSKVLTRSGVNAQVGGLAEIIYPTAYRHSAFAGRPEDPCPATRASPPRKMQTRGIGTILNVTPTVGPDGHTIDLSLVPELAELAGWDDVGIGGTTADGKKVGSHMRQPRFHSRNLSTSVVLWDGGTVVLGGFRGEDGNETIYAFISARLVNPAGRKP